MVDKSVRYATAQVFDGGPNSFEAKMASLREIGAKALQGFTDGKLSADEFNGIMAKAEAAQEDLATQQRTRTKAMHYAGSADSAAQWQANGGIPQQSGGVARKCKNISPMDVPQADWYQMFEALRHKQPYRMEIGTKGFSDGSGIGFKTPGAPVAEGASWPTGLLPPINVPGLTQELPFEPDRLADHIPSITIDSPSIEFLRHTGNTNTAASVNPVAEAGLKVDLGQQWDTATATPIKLAALASVTARSPE